MTAPHSAHPAPPRLIVVGGHESDNGADLAFLSRHFDDLLITAAGRPLHRNVSRVLDSDDRPILVLPMTFGRNPTVVADTAKTLKWLAVGEASTRIALCDPFGTPDHLIAWLRTAATQVAAADPAAALVITARASNPFDDAELYRIAHLVITHGSATEVDVACVDQDADVARSVTRMRKLGFDHTVVVPAGFARSSSAPFGTGELAGSRFYGPLMSEQAIVRVITERISDAEHNLGHGHNGISAGLEADHGHGYAHSHAFEDGQPGHSHPHSHEHSVLTHTH